MKVWVEASVQFTSIAEAKTIEKRILDNLQQFFHPLHGGPEKKGWDFGRNVYISEIYGLIENTDGVDYVNDLVLKVAAQTSKLELKESIVLPVAYPEHSTVDLNNNNGRITFFLAEMLPEDNKIDELYIMGFREGDQVKISDKRGNYISTLSIKSVLDNNILECETDTAISISEGSIVETPEGIRSYTTKVSEQELEQNKNIRLTVATFSHDVINSESTEVVLRHRADPKKKQSLIINKSTNRVNIVFIDENCLVYSGEHTINK
jgi:formylmethanofuran dehydrogenase subunit D